MALLEWHEHYSLGIPAIDHEHRELIGLLNELVEALSRPGAREEVLDCFGEVHSGIASHFALEEKIMRDRNYDEYAEHKADHYRLLEELRDIMDEYESAGQIDAQEFAGRLDRWFTEHFKNRDARLHGRLGSR